jgi:hypothetical protein
MSDMTVRGPVMWASVTSGSVKFGGMGRLNMQLAQGSQRETMTVRYSATVTPGGAGVGTLALTVRAAKFAMTEHRVLGGDTDTDTNSGEKGVRS